MTDPDFDCPPEMSDAALSYRDLEFERDDIKEWLHELALDWQVLFTKYEDARSLLDGCYEIVELFNPETPSQIEWKRKWLEDARKHGASWL